MAKKNQSALLAKYFSMYQKNPRSKVFAPLAESFRKLGMIEDALKILREGIRHHPNYALGYIVLAHCYYDQEKYDLTYSTLRPIIAQNADNISLQKIFAQACIHLGHLEEALEVYKYLLFMNPQDKFFAEQVKKLEDDLMVGHKKIGLDQLLKSPDLPKTVPVETTEDDWVQVDFARPEEKKEIPAEETPDEWSMEKPGTLHPLLESESIPKRSLEDDYYADEFDEYGNIEEVNDASMKNDAPYISHTLIDLYCAQNYFDKAIELLNKMLELNPEDAKTKEKLSEVLSLKQAHEGSNQTNEEDGHNELISIIENKVKAKSPQVLKIQSAFDSFLDALKDKSLNYR